jgi:hypothetical protein
MPNSKVVYSSNVGNPWKGEVAPNTRRKLNVENKSKKGKK